MAIIPLNLKLSWYDPSQPGGVITTQNNNVNTATSTATQYTMQDIINTVSATGGAIDGSGAQYALPVFTDTNTITNLPLGTAGQVLTSGGPGVDPSWVTSSAGATNINGLSDAAAGDGLTTGGTSIMLGQTAPWAVSGGFQGGMSFVAGFEAMNTYNSTRTTPGNYGRHISIGWRSNYLRDGIVHAYNAFAIGNEACRDWNPATSVNQVTAIGNLAMRSSINSTDCIAIGTQSLVSLGSSADTVGNPSDNAHNVAIGIGTWLRGRRNVSIGFQAGPQYDGNQVTTPVNENTVIGFQAGSSGSGAIQNCMLLGYQAQPTSASATNEITLGNSSITALRCQVTSITALSDERDKKDIVDLDKGLDTVMALKPRKFVWDNRAEQVVKDYQPIEFNDDGSVSKEDSSIYEEVFSAKKGTKDIGFIAQELQSVDDDYLQLVYDKNPDKLEASYGRLVPVLVKAIQELSAKVTALENA